MVVSQIKLFTWLIEGIRFSRSRARVFFLNNHRAYIKKAIKPSVKIIKLS